MDIFAAHAKTTSYPTPSHPDLEPDLDVVLQAEAPMACMPVRIEGVTRVKQLPYDDRSARTITVAATAYTPVLTADPYRAKAEIRGIDQDILVSYVRNPQVGDPNYERVPKGSTLVITARVAVSVAAQTGTTAVSIAQERLAHSE
ncbi:hypothetical protein AB0D63_43285 [Kitasatospora sp. NPDC048343]|uniref:hypothetical protein n=1 Tax=Kitasatospora sp. NPDC048343 TaxID=3154717 RepID=UPI0034113DA4